MALIGYAATLPPGDGYTSVSMIGATGGVHGDDARNVNLVYGGGQPSAMATGYGDGHVLALLQEFADSIAESREPDNTGERRPVCHPSGGSCTGVYGFGPRGPPDGRSI